MDELYKITFLVAALEQSGIEFCDTFERWWMTASAFADLGESGRALFHRLARMSQGRSEDGKPKYSKRKSDAEFSRQMIKGSTRKVHLGTFIRWCQELGIDLPKDGKTHHRTNWSLPPTPPPPPPTPPTYIDAAQVEQDHLRYKETGFYEYFHEVFAKANAADALDEACDMYQLGASDYYQEKVKRPAASFPLQNVDGLYVDCHIMQYNRLTGSSKFKREDGEEYDRYVNWRLSLMRDEQKRLEKEAAANGEEVKHKEITRAPWPNFGDHLLKGNPDAEIHIVESEKSAIIMAANDIRLGVKSRIWIAVAGKGKLKPEYVKQYVGRKIVVYPDRDGCSEWEEKAEILDEAGFQPYINKKVLKYPGNPKDDLADVVIRIMQGTQAPPAKEEEPPAAAQQEPPSTSGEDGKPKNKRLGALLTYEMVNDMKRLADIVDKYPNNMILVEKLNLLPVSMEPVRSIRDEFNQQLEERKNEEK